MGFKIRVGPRAQQLKDQIAADVRMLERLNLMDYSLLVGVHYLDRADEDSRVEMPPAAAAQAGPEEHTDVDAAEAAEGTAAGSGSPRPKGEERRSHSKDERADIPYERAGRVMTWRALTAQAALGVRALRTRSGTTWCCLQVRHSAPCVCRMQPNHAARDRRRELQRSRVSARGTARAEASGRSATLRVRGLRHRWAIAVPIMDAAPASSSLFRLDFGGIRGADPVGNPTNEIYFIGIIDFLTEYGLRKQAEHAVKSLVSDGVRR
jgi:hypothetical protein